MLTLKQLQKEQKEWSARNFPNNEPWMPLLGVQEEVGELSHSFLKRAQGIRGTDEQHYIDMVDAVGDIMVYLSDFCSRSDIDFQEALEKTWGTVKKRDWQKNKKDGSV